MMTKIKYISLAVILFSLLFTASNAQTQHYIDIWGGGGYSSLLHGIENSKTPGGMGGNIGLGYELHYNSFILQSGVDFSYMGSKTKMSDFTEEYKVLYPPLSMEWDAIYSFSDYQEKQRFAYLSIPLMFGMKFNRYYALLGTKVGINMSGSYQTNSLIEPRAKDPEAFDEFENIDNHYINEFSIAPKGKLDLGLNVTGSAEFGVVLDEWLPDGMKSLNNNIPISYRAGWFIDYGLLNINKSSTINPRSFAVGEGIQDISVGSISSSILANGKSFNNLYTGLKLTLSFQTPTRKPAPKRRTPAPLPILYVAVNDQESGAKMGGVEVSARITPGNRQVFRRNTSPQGMLNQKMRIAKYQITAKAAGYFEYQESISHNETDTLYIAMKRIPVLTVRVIDAESSKALLAEVEIISTADNKQMKKAATNAADGMMQHAMKEGKYLVNVNSDGYIFQKEEVDFTHSDTLKIALQAIKKDVKVVLENLFFEFAKADIMPESEPTLQDLYQFLADNPQVKIHIVGHTDNVGSESYNLNLSKNRAHAVYDALVKKGTDKERLSFEGKGSNEPITTNDTEEGRAKNRRVEFMIIDSGK